MDGTGYPRVLLLCDRIAVDRAWVLEWRDRLGDVASPEGMPRRCCAVPGRHRRGTRNFNQNRRADDVAQRRPGARGPQIANGQA